jgi:hypothetical protein
MSTSPVAACVPPLWAVAIYFCVLIGSTGNAGAPLADTESPAIGATIAVHPVTATTAEVTQGVVRPLAGRRKGAWCPECGVVESIRETTSDDLVHGDAVSGGVSPAAGTAHTAEESSVARAPRRYTVTLRFRDGSAVTTEEASRRAWTVGQRVIVVRSAGTPGP